MAIGIGAAVWEIPNRISFLTLGLMVWMIPALTD